MRSSRGVLARGWTSIWTIALSGVVLYAAPAIALPGQSPEEVVEDANQKGWKITDQEFKPRHLYGFGKQSDWKRVEGRTAYERRSFRIKLDDHARVESEFLDYSADGAYVDGDVETADKLWSEYVQEFYEPAISKEILEGRPIRRIVAITGKGKNNRNRISVIVGKEWLYKVEITETYTDDSRSKLKPQYGLEYVVRVSPKSDLQKTLNDLMGRYNWIIEDSAPPTRTPRR